MLRPWLWHMLRQLCPRLIGTVLYCWSLEIFEDIIPGCVLWKRVGGEDIRKQISLLMHFVKPMAKLVFLLRIMLELRPGPIMDIVA